MTLRFALVLALVAFSALARDGERLGIRTILLSEHPENATERLYVRGQVVTVLRFDQPCNPSKTQLLNWEGRFEPLACVGKHVVLEPLRDLDPDEAVSLLVTLKDGTEIPFLLRPPKRGEWGFTDQQVNVFKNRESYAAMSSALNDALKKNTALQEEVDRFRQEATSEDHALAALLAAGAVKQTPFRQKGWFSGKDADAEADVRIFSGKGKAAVVLTLKNLDAELPWSLRTVRLVPVAGGRERAVAVRATAPSIAPGTSGAVAFVADGSAFLEGGRLTSLRLEIYRHDGLQQAFVQLDPSLIGE